MLQQDLTPRRITTPQAVRMILVIIVVLALTSLFVSVFIRLTGFGLWDVLTFLVAGYIVYRIMTRVLRSYRYTWSEGVLTLERRYGQTTRSFLQVTGQEMLFLSPESQGAMDAARRQVMAPPDTPSYWLIYLDGGVRNAVQIAPNSELLAALSEAVAQNSEIVIT